MCMCTLHEYVLHALFECGWDSGTVNPRGYTKVLLFCYTLCARRIWPETRLFHTVPGVRFCSLLRAAWTMYLPYKQHYTVTVMQYSYRGRIIRMDEKFIK